MGNNILFEEEIRKSFLAYNMDEDPTGAQGHALADAALRISRKNGKSIKDWLGIDTRKNIVNILENTGEKAIAESICKRVSEQRIPMKDAKFIIESVLKEYECRHIYVKGRLMPLSKARDHLVHYARGLLYQYNLPMEPIDKPDLFSQNKQI
jgi:type III secretion system FlhB-like substrate exporter